MDPTRNRIVSVTFSPMMIGEDSVAFVEPITLDEAIETLREAETFRSIIGHEVTADLLSRMVGVEIPHNRESVSISLGWMIIVCPQFRADESREFSREELLASKWRAFSVTVLPKDCDPRLVEGPHHQNDLEALLD